MIDRSNFEFNSSVKMFKILFCDEESDLVEAIIFEINLKPPNEKSYLYLFNPLSHS